jgi:hypothetical protein
VNDRVECTEYSNVEYNTCEMSSERSVNWKGLIFILVVWTGGVYPFSQMDDRSYFRMKYDVSSVMKYFGF